MFDSALSQSPLSSYGAELVDQSNALLNQVSNQFNDVLTMIDRDHYSSHEKEILAWQPQQPPQSQELVRVSDSSLSEKSMHKPPKRSHKRDHPKGQTTAAATVVSGSIFSKVELYANSRLPMNLQPLKLYVSFFALAVRSAINTTADTFPPTPYYAWQHSTLNVSTTSRRAPRAMPTSMRIGELVQKPWSSSQCRWIT